MLNWIISSSVLIAGILLLRQMLRGKISLRLQYALWLVVLVRLLCPVNFFHSGLSVQNAVDMLERPAYQAEADEIHTNAPPVENPIQKEPQTPVPDDSVIVQQNPDALAPEQNTGRPQQDTPMAQELDWALILTGIWLAGSVVMLSFTFGCNYQFARMLARNRRAVEVPDASVPVYISSWVKTPCLVGVFRPVIYLTPQVGEDPSTWNHVIRHEMTHLEHFDHAFSLLRCLALCLHWFNPLVWIAARMSKEDAELACDEGTIARLGEGERIGYGETLIRLTCRSRNPSDLMITATTMIGTHSGIKARILYLAKKPKTLAYALVVGLLAVGLMVGCTFTGAAEDPEETRVREFYEGFIEQKQTNPVYALEQFVYMEDENSKIVALAHAERGEVATSVEILNVEKLSEDLWAVEISYVHPANPEGDTGYNFVGKIDGAYKVMRNVLAIPEELSRGLDLEPYYPTGDFTFMEDAIDQADTETTVPTTVPPETTEPAAPKNYVNLTQMIEGTDITMTVDGHNITLTEDGLTVEMSTLRKEVYRRGYIAGIMRNNPIIEDGQVYIHGNFFRYFFCKESTDIVSMFHGAQFFADEVITALENPDASSFNIKLLENVCLPSSMGIQIPNIDAGKIFSERPMSELPDILSSEIRSYGYTGTYVYGEYSVIVDSRLAENSSLTVGEYRRQTNDVQAILDRMTDEQEAFFAEKQIQLDDYYDLNSWYHGGFMDHTDEELIEALETCYRSKLALSLGWDYPG